MNSPMPATSSNTSPHRDTSTEPTRKRAGSRSESPTPVERPAKRARCEEQTIRFLIMSDTHDADHDSPSSFHPPTDTPVDVVLHCGDLTQNGTLASLAPALTKLAAIPAELRLVIAGNHEITLGLPYYLCQGGSPSDHRAASQLVRAAAAAQGVAYLDEGTHAFTLRSGATFCVYASPYTPQHGESAFQCPTHQDRFNPAATTPASTIPDGGIDVVMAHGPPQYVLDATESGASGGCEHLRRAVCRAKPRLHCFGHVHRGYGAQRVEFQQDAGEGGDDGMVCLPKEWVGKNQARRKGYAALSPGSREAMAENRQSLMVNAAVMDERGRPATAPWLVELEL